MKNIPEYLLDALHWLCASLSGILIPIIGSIILSLAFKLGLPQISSLTHGGQFALYSIAMTTTTFYILTRNAPKPLPFTRGIGLVVPIVFAIAIILFAIAVSSQNGQPIDSWIIEWPTIGLFFVCLIITFITFVLDKRRQISSSDFKRMDDEKQKKLNKQFEASNQQ